MSDKLKVVITDEQKDIKVETGIRMLLRRCCHAVLENEEYKGSAKIGITFTDNERLHERSMKHYGKQAQYEVLTLPNKSDNEEAEMPFIGDVYISFEKAVEVAKQQNETLKKHLARITAYGVLELLGYEHKNHDIYDKADLAMYQLGLPISSIYYVLNN